MAAPAGILSPAETRVIPVLRGSERVVLAFLLAAAVLVCCVPAEPQVRLRIWLVNLAVALACVLALYAESFFHSLPASVVRDWLPLGAILVAYREMGWLARPHLSTALESHWVVWDRALLRHGGKLLIEAAGPVVPSLLEIAYALVYALPPFALAALYLYRRRGRADRLLTLVCASVLACYIQFPFWPSEPPRVVFAGEDLPLYLTVFRRFNLWVLSGAGIHTSVFPSAHVAGAFATAFGIRAALPQAAWLYRLLMAMAVLIFVAVVYGRYHYLADAAAGLAIAVIFFSISCPEY